MKKNIYIYISGILSFSYVSPMNMSPIYKDTKEETN
jgi:hypothetical protein